MRDFPTFHPTASEREWVASERNTARVVRTLWDAASPAVRRLPAFLVLLVRCGWENNPSGDGESTRRWRNGHFAKWLNLPADFDDAMLAEALGARLRLTVPKALWVAQTATGITHYYKPFRGRAIRLIASHAKTIGDAFNRVSKYAEDPLAKVHGVAKELDGLPKLRAPAGGHTSLLSALTPVVACLDPQRRFPIMNQKTQRLLKALGKVNDADGAVSLSGLIGQFGLRDAFDLDVYAAGEGRRFNVAITSPTRIRTATPVGPKDEQAGFAELVKKTIRRRKEHNRLINRFRQAVEWRHELAESEFDVLIRNWKGTRHLLIEAKTGTTGVGGRAQLRQAIGQLFDYRWRSYPHAQHPIDLALLVPAKPAPDVLQLLKRLRIEVLWFDGERLEGTIRLLG